MAVIVTVDGNLTTDPELRQTQNGHSVCDFQIANSSYRRNQTTREFEKTGSTFVRCNAWDDLAQTIAGNAHKGTAMIVAGRLQTRSYTAQDGSKRSVLELRVDDAGISMKHNHPQRQQQGYQQPVSRPQASYQRPAQAQAPRTTQAQRPVQRPQRGASNWASNRDYSNGAGFGGGTADQRPLGPGEDPQF